MDREHAHLVHDALALLLQLQPQPLKGRRRHLHPAEGIASTCSARFTLAASYPPTSS